VHASEIGGYGEDSLAGAQLVEGLEQVRPDFFLRHLSCRASSCEKEAHMVLILLSVGRWFLDIEFEEENSGERKCDFLAVLLVFLIGVLEFRVFFDGNLLVDSW
jgi:hypothetical protein